MDINLKRLADDVINDTLETKIREVPDCQESTRTKVKILTAIGLKTYDGFNNVYKTKDGKIDLENQINDFLNSLESYQIVNIQISVNKNFLPATTAGEYEEFWVANIVYEE